MAERTWGLVRRVGWFVLVICVLGGPRALAQETPDGAGHDVTPARSIRIEDLRGPADTLVLVDNGLPNVLLTGYWPPTNEMLRQFSPSPVQNPGAWVGLNWEGRGYNVYAFFPEFPGGTGVNPKGDGDFEVDYQDTSADWWPLLEKLRPIALITFSRANTTIGWEMEGGNRTYSASYWTADYLAPTKPTSEMPLYYEPHLFERWSTLPMQAIVDAVAASGANLDPFISAIDTGRFLSDCIGYHGNWWHDLHADPNDPIRNYAAGHIHVGTSPTLADAVLATEISVRTLLTHVDGLRPPIADVDGDGNTNGADFVTFDACMSGPDNPMPAGCDPADFARADTNRDGDSDLADFSVIQAAFGSS